VCWPQTSRVSTRTACKCDQQPERVFQASLSKRTMQQAQVDMYRAFQLVSAWLEESTCVVRMYTRESRVICTSRLAYTVWHLRALGHHHKAVRLSKVVALAVLAAIVDATSLERLLSALERRHPPAIAHSQRVPTSTTALSSTLVMWQTCSCFSCGSLCVYRLAS